MNAFIQPAPTAPAAVGGEGKADSSNNAADGPTEEEGVEAAPLQEDQGAIDQALERIRVESG